MARLDPADLEQFRIRGGDAEFEEALASGTAPKSGGRVSVKAGSGLEAGASGRAVDGERANAEHGSKGGGSGKKRKGGENGGMLYQKSAKRTHGKFEKRRSGGKSGQSERT